MPRPSVTTILPVLLFLLLATLACASGLPAWAESVCIIVSPALLVVCAVLAWRLWRSQNDAADLLEALHGAGAALLVVDEERKLVHVNDAFLSLCDQSTPVQNARDFPAPLRNWFEEHIQQALASGRSAQEERLIAPNDISPATLLRLSAARIQRRSGGRQVLLWCENMGARNETASAALEREHALRTRSQAFIQTLIDVIPRPVFVKDDAGRYTLVNQAFCAVHEKDRNTVIGQTATELGLDNPNAQTIALEDARVMAGAPVFKEEFSATPGKPEDDRFTIVSKQACVDPFGRRVLVGTHMDITPWRLAERELRTTLSRETSLRERTQDFFQRLIDVLPYPVCIKNAESRYVLVNEAFAQSRGMSRNALLSRTGKEVIKVIVPNDSPLRPGADQRAQQGLEEDRRVLAGELVRKEENNILDQHGNKRDQIVSKATCTDPNGQQVIVVSLFDITELRNTQRELDAALQAEKARRERTEAFIERLLDVIPEPVYVKDAQARYVVINQAFAAQRQQSKSEILGKSAAELAPDSAVAARVLAEDFEILAGKSVRFLDDTPHPITHAPRWRLISKGSCLGPEGQPVIVGANFDVTSIRQAEQQLALALQAEQGLRQRTQSFLQRLIDALPLPIGVRDQESRHICVNAAFIAETGLSREQIIGRRITDFVTDAAQIEASQREDQAVFNGQSLFEEKQDLGLSGERLRDLIISKRSCLDVDDHPVLVVAHIDVSRQREAERQALALMANEKSLRTRTQDYIQRLIDVIPHPFFVKDQESRYVLFNEALLEEFRLPREKLLGRSTLEIAADPIKARAILEEDQEVLAGAEVREERHETATTGGTEWADRLIVKRRCLDVDGCPVVAVIHLDLTALRAAQQQLESALQRETLQSSTARVFLQQVMEGLPMGVVILDDSGNVLQANAAWLREAPDTLPDLALDQKSGQPVLQTIAGVLMSVSNCMRPDGRRVIICADCDPDHLLAALEHLRTAHKQSGEDRTLAP